jgi:hypothetical protein
MKGIDLFGENGRKRKTKIKIFQKDINSLRLVWFQLANFMVPRRSFIKNDNELLCFTKGGGREFLRHLLKKHCGACTLLVC